MKAVTPTRVTSGFKERVGRGALQANRERNVGDADKRFAIHQWTDLAFNASHRHIVSRFSSLLEAGSIAISLRTAKPGPAVRKDVIRYPEQSEQLFKQYTPAGIDTIHNKMPQRHSAFNRIVPNVRQIKPPRSFAPMDISEAYLQLRSYLFAIAYNMTGSVQEAEDLVQDGLEGVLRSKAKSIAAPKAYCTRIVVNKSLDRIRQLQKQRVHYPGNWLPEPYTNAPDQSANDDVLPYAILHLVERLNPVERAVFILREAFRYKYAELAAFCQITEANSRQILHRAKEKLQKQKLPDALPQDTAPALLQAFLKASLEERTEDLHALLRQDIKLYSDGGGKARAARKTVEGAENVTKLFVGITRKLKASWSAVHPVVINNQPGLLMTKEAQPDLVLAFSLEPDGIQTIFLIRNPDKISHLRLSQNIVRADIG